MSLDELIHKYVEDRASLDEAELDQLIAGLRESPARAIELREQLILDDFISQKLAFDRRQFFTQVEQRIADFEQGEDEIQSQVVELRSLAEAEFAQGNATGRDGTWWKVLLAVAAVLALGAFLIGPQLLKSGSEPLATVERADGSVLLTAGEEEAAVVLGHRVSAGQQFTTPAHGTLELRFQDNTLVTIGADSRVTIDADPQTGGKLVHVERGELFAEVQKQRHGRPMVFVTPQAWATVLGTRLRLTVDDRATRLDVIEGQVELRRRSDGQSLLVSTAQTGIAAADNLAQHRLRWPDNRDGMIFLFDGDARNTLVRSPQNLDVLQVTQLHAHPERTERKKGPLQLDGGYFDSTEAGNDLLALLKGSNELTVEIVFEPPNVEPTGLQNGLAPVLSFALVADGKESKGANFVLGHDAQGFVARLRLGNGNTESAPPREFRLGDVKAGTQQHFALTYRDGKLLAALDGEPIFESSDAHGNFTNWGPMKLLVGNEHHAGPQWPGNIAAIAIYSRALDLNEIRQSARNYRQMGEGSGETKGE
jgi:hypothetical protein